MAFEFKVNRHRRSCLLHLNALFAVGLLALSGACMAADKVLYYRYVDDKGVTSTSNTIPPKYSQNGYEVIYTNGKVRVVEPAPDPEEVKRAEAEMAKLREQTAAYEVLARRYSSVEDIYKARDRRLAHLDASIAILQSTINTIENEIDGLTSKAANIERQGREVGAHILSSLTQNRAELETTRSKLKLRMLEHDDINHRFEEDVKLFEKGKAYFEAQRR